MKDLRKWKESRRRKPLLLLGARQVGKTWMMRNFGREEYKEVAYVRFDRESTICDTFLKSSDTRELLDGIRAYTGCRLVPGKSLIILDEIQDCPPVIASLKFFCEETPEQHIMAAGSLLGLTAAGGTGFPVGKVDMMELYPMNFNEFLQAIGEVGYARALREHKWEVLNHLREALERLLRIYYYVGGMPEAVSIFAETRDYTTVRRYHKTLLSSYSSDFAKHTVEREARDIARVWEMIPAQLARENRQFMPSKMPTDGMPLGRTRMPLRWLHDAGLIHNVPRVRVPELPLSGYTDNAFKVFSTDVGLLAAQSGLSKTVLLEKNSVFAQYKGAFTEQYVMQELLCSGFSELFYWKAAQAQAEIDFMVAADGRVVPVEVKAEHNLQAKSLKSYCKRYVPEVAVRCSMVPYRKTRLSADATTGTTLLDVPLWGIGELHSILVQE